MEGRLEKEGNIGIYSSDSALFGNISYGNESDRAKVEKARENGDKNNLVMTIPYPIVRDSAGNEYDNKASFILGSKDQTKKSEKAANMPVDAPESVKTKNKYEVILRSSGLAGRSHTISFDPTVQITNSADVSKLNNEGGD